MVDFLSNLVAFFLTGDQEHGLVGASKLLPNMQAGVLIADKGHDADGHVLEPLAAVGKAAVIPVRAKCNEPREFDRDNYKARHLIARAGGNRHLRPAKSPPPSGCGSRC